MEREIKIFKSFEEQEAYQLDKQKKTTPEQRLANLFYMQNLSRKFRSNITAQKKIIITHGFIAS